MELVSERLTTINRVAVQPLPIPVAVMALSVLLAVSIAGVVPRVKLVGLEQGTSPMSGVPAPSQMSKTIPFIGIRCRCLKGDAVGYVGAAAHAAGYGAATGTVIAQAD